MKELRREAMVDTTEQLLFDILQELKKLNEVREYTESIETPIELCKLCGKDHTNKGFALACAKKNKKKEGV